MESKDQVRKHLQKHKADDIRLFHTLMTKSLLANNDFMIALEADKDDGGQSLKRS